MDCIAQSIGSQRVRHDWVTFTFKELRKSQRFRVSGRRELTVTFSETLGLWLTEDYAQWHVCTSVTLPCSWGVLCISSSELKPRSFLWDKSLIRLSQGIWGVSFFSFSFIKLPEPSGQKHCGLVSQRRVQNKWKECFKYPCYFNTKMQDGPKFGLFQNRSSKR